MDMSVKKAELKLAAHIACHSSIQTVDHLGELVHSISGEDFAIHRTKCTALIKCVIGPSVHLERVTEKLGYFGLHLETVWAINFVTIWQHYIRWHARPC